jgi:peptidoglycan/xylan/chitin deacetylase (PgdA/CDA1 family)
MYWWQHPGAEAFGIEALKRLPNKERLRRLDEAGFRPEAEWPVRKALSLEQLRDLQSVADFQSHTRLHPILNKCDDDECRDEIVESKREVEALTKRPCEHFAFPNGNYDDRAIRILKEAGYRSARTADLGWNDQTTDIFRLRSILIADDASLSWLDAQLSHVPNLLKYAMRGSFNGRFPQF